nr:unnamed protein product [Spirometra erinaceieuropaei]
MAVTTMVSFSSRLAQTNTLSRLPKLKKTTWMHSRSRRWQLPKCFLIWRRDRQEVTVTKAICDADDWTDHRLVITRMRSCLKPNRRLQDFSNQLAQHLEVLPAPDFNATVETRWRQLHDVVQSTALGGFGCARR